MIRGTKNLFTTVRRNEPRTLSTWVAEGGSSLTFSEKLLLVRTGCLLTFAEVLVRTIGVSKCRRLLAAASGYLPRRSWRYVERDRTVRWIANLIDIARVRFSLYPTECLTRSIVLAHVLSRYGIEAELVLGVRKLLGNFEAHAWVEVDGQPLNEKEPVNRIYSRFDIDRRL